MNPHTHVPWGGSHADDPRPETRTGGANRGRPVRSSGGTVESRRRQPPSRRASVHGSLAACAAGFAEFSSSPSDPSRVRRLRAGPRVRAIARRVARPGVRGRCRAASSRARRRRRPSSRWSRPRTARSSNAARRMRLSSSETPRASPVRCGVRPARRRRASISRRTTSTSSAIHVRRHRSGSRRSTMGPP